MGNRNGKWKRLDTLHRKTLHKKTTETNREWDELIEERIHDKENNLWRRRASSKPKLRTYIKHKKNNMIQRILDK